MPARGVRASRSRLRRAPSGAAADSDAARDACEDPVATEARVTRVNKLLTWTPVLSLAILLPCLAGCGCETSAAAAGGAASASASRKAGSPAAAGSPADGSTADRSPPGAGQAPAADAATPGAGTPGAGTSGATTDPSVSGAPVSVAKVERRDVPLQIHAIGTVESPASVVLRPQMDGRIVEVRFTEGDDVKAGDVLVVLDDRPAQAALALAEADLARDRAMAKDADLNAQQVASVNDRRAVSERVMQQSRAAADAAQAGVAADEARLQTARLAVEYCTVRAPFDGRTGLLGVRVGSVVKENDSELVTVSQIAPVRVMLSVPQDRLPEIVAHHGLAPLAVEVSIADGSTAAGTLTFIDSAVDSTTGTIRLMATFPNADRGLWPGQYVQAALDVSTDRGALVVPARAVQTGQQGSYVFVVRADRTAELRPVDVRRGAGDVTLIGNGLAEGETVVTEGQLRLVDGAPVSFGG